jgi:hypothetical protein
MEGNVSFTGDFQRKARFCFTRIPCFLGAPRDMYEKALKTDISLLRVLVAVLGGGLF